MSISLISVSKGYLKNSLINKASTFLEEDNENIKNCINCIITVLQTKLTTYTNSESDLSSIYNLIKNSHFSNLKYINLEDIFKGENSLLIQESNSFLRFLCQNEFDEVSQVISETYDVHKESSSTLFLMILPIIIGATNDVIVQENLDINDFSKLLKAQEKYLSHNTIPIPLANKLISDFGFPPFKDNILKTTPQQERNVKFKTITAIISSLLLVGFILYSASQTFNMFNADKKSKDEVSETVINNTINDENAFYHPTKKVLNKYIKGYEFLGYFTERKLKNGKVLIVLSNGGEANLINFIESNISVNHEYWFPFRRIIASKGINEVNIEKSKNQINNIIAILKAYPNVHINIAGYSYIKKNPVKNFEISYDFAGKVTREILKGGINKNRIKFEGYGNNFSLSKDKKQLLKRVDIRVIRK